MQEMVGKIQKATVGLFEGILQSRSNVSISGIRVFKRLAVHERLWSHRGKYKKKKKKNTLDLVLLRITPRLSWTPRTLKNMMEDKDKEASIKHKSQ